jgi:uncharacterized protein (TIGR03437 family)
VAILNRRDFLRTVAVGLAGTAATAVPLLGASLVRSPFVQDVRRTRATIRWSTRESGAGSVDFWDEDGRALRVPAQMRAFLPAETGLKATFYRFEATLTKLLPGSRYRYQVALNEEPLGGRQETFRTPGTAPFQFLAFGDSGTGSQEQKLISKLLLQHAPEFILHTGDLVYPTGTYERYEALYFEYYKDLMKDIPFFPCPGNHDYYETSAIPYRAMHSLPAENVVEGDAGRYYSFDWGNAHFVSLDSNDCLVDASEGKGGMLEWMDHDLSATHKFWRIILVHHPVYSAGNHSDEPEAHLMRKWIAPLVDKHKVPLVINGHEHSYQRTLPIRAGKVAAEGEGTVYLTTGGGGADLHPVGTADFLKVGLSTFNYVAAEVVGAKLRLKAFDLEDKPIDDFAVIAKPIFVEDAVVNAADFKPRLAPGSLVSIFGLQLAPDEEASSLKLPLPKLLGGAHVSINDIAVPMLLASARQINVQIPLNLVGDCRLTVTNVNGSTTIPIDVVPFAPAIFAQAIFRADGSALSSEAPARVGETLTLYATGLGALSTPMEVGKEWESSPVQAKVEIKLDDTMLSPTFAASSKGTPGVYQIRFVVPALAAGAHNVAIRVGGALSNGAGFPVA